jgi:transposase
MQDTELYQRLLGIEKPWDIDTVDLDMAEGRVDIRLKHDRAAEWPCPECAKPHRIHDHVAERTWRHLDTCQVRTFVHARTPRVECAEHGIRQVVVPWAEPRSRFTLLMERFAIDVLLNAASVTAACELLGVSWDEASGIMKRAVARGLVRKQARVPTRIGVDEKAFRKGQSYVTVVCDIDRGTVEHVAPGRKIESLRSYYDRFMPQELEAIEAVAMDMWVPYFQATIACVPDAGSKIVFDRFHAMSYAVDAVDQVRREEHAALTRTGDSSLKKTRFLWLYSHENLPDRHRPLFGILQQLNLKVGRAWAYKESLRDLWAYVSEGCARRFFADWYAGAIRSRLEPIKRVARMLRRHLDNIVTHCKHPVTQGVAEGLNSKIMAIKRYACGFRSIENFQTAILFHCGGLNLYPATTA